MEMELEKKTFPFEIKELTKEGTFEGYAAIFGKPDAHGEIVEKGAFSKSLKEKDFFTMCWFHNPRDPIGIVYLVEDQKGLKVKGELNLEVQSAREKLALMKQKAIRGLSFGFNTIKDIWDGNKRRLKEVKLFEVSPVTFGAHPGAIITNVKQWDEQKPFPNEHSARIKNPNLFDSETYRRKKDGTIYGKIKVPMSAAVIWGKLKEHNKPSDNPFPQSIRFPTDNWTVVQAKAWLKDNNVKYERFEPASKSIEGVLEFLEDMKDMKAKSGQEISAANLKLIDVANKALTNLLEVEEPSKDTPDEEKGIYSSIVEGLKKTKMDKPQSHLFESTIKTLEKSKKE